MNVLHTLGRCAIETDAGVITPRAPVVFALGLKLLMHPGRRVTRGTLLSTLWGVEVDEGIQRRLLRKNLFEARTRGLHIYSANTDELWIPPDKIRTDVDYLASESVETLLARDYSVLPGYTPDSSWPAFNDQVDDFRERTQRQIIVGLLAATERQKAEGEWRAVQQLAALLLSLDNVNQRASELHARASRILRRQRVPETALDAYTKGQSSSTNQTMPLRIVGSTPTTVYNIRGNTRLHGRKEDLAILTSSFLDAVRARGGAVYLHGAPGIGKSRLVREFIDIARTDGAVIVQTTCEPEHAIQPLAPFVTLVPQLLELAGASARKSQWLEYLHSLVHPAKADLSYEWSGGSDIPVTADRLHYAISDLLALAAQDRPLIIVIENIQWCHQASWLVLKQLLSQDGERHHEQLIVFTSREPWHDETLGIRPPSVKAWHLGKLDRSTSERHIRDYLAVLDSAANDDLIQWWVSVAEGNPYFHEELVSHWGMTQESFSAPSSLHAVVDARLGRLTPQALYVLQACAALGEHSSPSWLLQSLGYSRHELLGALAELGRAGMLASACDTPADDQQRVMCRHDVIAARALNRLSRDAKTLLHASIGAVLESALDELSSAAVLWSCANHWYQANNRTRAVALGIECASYLWSLDLITEAVAVCRKTLGFCPDDEARYRVLRALAYMLYKQWNWDNLFLVLASARRLQSNIMPHGASHHDDLELLALDGAWHAEKSWRPILEATMRCVASPDADAGHRIKAGVIALKIATNLGDTHLMHQVYDFVHQTRNSTAALELQRLEFEMIYHAICGDPQKAADAATSLANTLREVHQKTETLPVLLNCGSALVRAGHGPTAVGIYTEVFERGVRLGVPYIARQAAHRLIAYYLDTDDIDLAEPWVSRCDDLDKRSAHDWHRWTLRVSRARIAISRGSYDEADALLVSGADALWKFPMDLFRSAALATKIRADVAREIQPEFITQLVYDLMVVHKKFCEMGSHDFETISLYTGLRYIGNTADARGILHDYITHRRRNNVKPTREVLAAVGLEIASGSGLHGETQFRDFLCMWQ